MVHREAEDALLAEVGARQLADDRLVAHDVDAVAHGNDLRQLRGNEQDGRALSAIVGKAESAQSRPAWAGSVHLQQCSRRMGLHPWR